MTGEEIVLSKLDSGDPVTPSKMREIENVAIGFGGIIDLIIAQNAYAARSHMDHP